MILCYPPDPRSNSKATWVMDSLKSSHPDHRIIRGPADINDTVAFWGLGDYQYAVARQCTQQNLPFLFTDMPYWNRWMGENRDTCHWRIIPNALHCNWVKDFPDDRFASLNINVQPWRKDGDHVLVCPSSKTMEMFLNEENWTNRIVEKIKQHTNRPIRVRYKPRKGKLSGPRVESVPFAEDAKGAWAVVTMCSITGVEAATLGIPVFCHSSSPCAPIGNADITNINSPRMPGRTAWLNNLAYYQYTEDELRSGIHRQILQ